MSKRGRSTGKPQARQAHAPAESTNLSPIQKLNPLREAHTRAEREAIIQRLILIGTAIAGGVIALLIIGAFVVDRVITPAQTVATINGDTITVADFQKRVRLERGLINDRLNAVFAEAAQFGDQGQQYLQFRLQQEPLASWSNEIAVSDQLGSRVLNDMIEDRLVRAEAAERGITVSEDDIQAQINQFFEYDPEAILEAAATDPDAEPTEDVNATPTPTPFVSPTPSPEPSSTPTLEPTEEATLEATADPNVAPTFTPSILTVTPTLDPTQIAEDFQEDSAAAFATIRNTARVSDDDIRAYFETQALRNALATEVLAEADLTEPYADVRHILVETEDQAQDVLAALDAGESFAGLARAVSTDPGSGQNGGELGWGPIARYVEPFADAIREAEIGAIVGPVESEFGYHIIQVRATGGEEMDEFRVEQTRAEEFETYLQEQRAGADNDIETFSIWADNVPSEPVFIPPQMQQPLR